MKNPYRLYVGEPLGEIVFDEVVVPGTIIAHRFQAHRIAHIP